jgi:ABC-2 type transport system ATP-binding protein
VEIRNLLEGLVHQNGLTLLMTSHDLDEVEKLCERMMIIEHGHAILEGKMDDLRKQGKPIISVELSEPLPASILEQLSAEFSALPYVNNLQVEGSVLKLTLSEHIDQVPNEVISSLTSLGIKFTGVNFEKRTLEDIYLQAMEPEIGASSE